MAGRKVADVDEAHELLDEYENRGGTSLANFARSKGIDGRSLNAWRINLERARTIDSGPLPEFIELVASGPVAAASSFHVRCGPFSVEVPARFDAEGLGRLLTVVAAC